MTRHPRMGAAGLPEVDLRRLVENKATREKILAQGLSSSARQVYLRKPVDSFGSLRWKRSFVFFAVIGEPGVVKRGKAAVSHQDCEHEGERGGVPAPGGRSQ